MTDEPAELADRHHRRFVRRFQVATIAAVATLLLGFVGWKAGLHLFATVGLGLYHYQVEWDVDRETWAHGGQSSVRSGYSWDDASNGRAKNELRFLPWVHRVEALDLSLSFGLTDAEMAILDELPELRTLNLERIAHPEWQPKYPVRLTDATLARVARLKQLRELYLGGQGITDAGLANLATLDRLESLGLQQTGITDAGLEQLKAFPSLKVLDVASTNVTAQGVANFEASRPGVKVLADPTLVFPPMTP